MPATVEETYKELWHYTTAEGLYGIITSQSLWATNIFYLNDDDEFKGFFDNKLYDLLRKGVNKGVQNALSSPTKRKHIESKGGVDSFGDQICKTMLFSIKTVSHQMQAFVTSFCDPSGGHLNNGLLSQWRGYGKNGGYAVIFETQSIKDLLDKEMKKYLYAFGHWGDVDYFDSGQESYEEAREWESKISRAAEELVFELNKEKFKKKSEEMFNPVLSLATRHKHAGYSEEKEVRVTLIPVIEEEIFNEAVKSGEKHEKKNIQFRVSSGMLVPYINLFGDLGGNCKLPIVKIVVGPHPEKIKRKRSLELMLQQHGLDIDVSVSEIPYVGG